MYKKGIYKKIKWENWGGTMEKERNMLRAKTCHSKNKNTCLGICKSTSQRTKRTPRKFLACILVALVFFMCFEKAVEPQNVYASENLTIDGNVDDWKDIADILEEPEGVFDRIAAYCDEENFNIIFVVNDINKWCYFQVYADTDNNSSTGFQSDGGGFEFLIENGTIYRSDAGEWPDTEVGKAEHEVSDDGSTYEIKVPFSVIAPKGKTINFQIKLLNDSWETVFRYPSGKTVLADVKENVTVVSDEPYISDFDCTQEETFALTAPAMQDGVIATFSANGGDGVDYKYNFITSEKNGWANSYFKLEGNNLITNRKLLEPGQYKVNVRVKSGVRSEIKSFTIKVGDAEPGSITEDIFTGDMGEWFIVDYNEAKDTQKIHTLQATMSQKKLFLMTSSDEKDMDEKSAFVLDTKKGKGYKYFGCEGADFVIHAQNLYPVIADNRIGAPITTVKEDYYNNYSTASLYLSDLGTYDYIKVHAFAKNRAVTIPAKGYMDVNKTFEMSYEDGYAYPKASYDAFSNPGMGWVGWSTISEKQAEETAFDFNMVYMPLTWANLETSKGFFDWDNVEKQYHVSYWENKGIQFVIRFVMDNPARLTGKRADETYGEFVDKAFITKNNLAADGKASIDAIEKLIKTGNYRMDIPTWLFAELCDEVLDGETQNAGTFYNWPSEDVLGGAGFSPNYEANAMISYHDACINAIAEKFDGKAAYIEMGSLGHWGELHTWPEADSFEEYDFGSGEFPGDDVIEQYGLSYLNAFNKTKVGIRESYGFSREQKFGMFNDVFGQQEGCETFLNDIYNCGEFWKTNYSGGEFASGDVLRWVDNDSFMQTLSYLRDSHTTWLGPCSPCDLKSGSIEASINKGNIDYLQTKMGYRFRVSKATKVESASAGSTLNLTLTFENEGLAPAYRDYEIGVALFKTDMKSQTTEYYPVTTTEWMPGTQNDVNVSLDIPRNASGEYVISVFMKEANSADTLVNLAMMDTLANYGANVDNANKMYALYTLEIN